MSEPQEQPTPVITEEQAKRANAPMGAMVLSVLVCVLAFLPIWLLNASPESDTFERNVDVAVAADRAAAVADFPPVAPELPEGWTSNYARWSSAGPDGVTAWEVGYVTGAGEFLSITQTADANRTWLAQQTDEAPEVGTRDIAGHSWQIRHQPEVDRSLILEHDGSTVIISGTADDEEFDILATAVVEDLKAEPVSAPSESAAETRP